jgi:glycosyltransferase involved in cell wall biosynthesis
MRIAINARFTGQEVTEGYGRFTNGLVGAMATANPADEYVMMHDRQPLESSVMRAGNIRSITRGPAARHPILWKIWYDVSMPAMAAKAGADIIFSPDGFCSLSTSIPQILAIHDLAFLHFPSGINSLYRTYYRHYTPQFIRKAKQIVTVSEFSRENIIHHYPAAKNKITVVHNAADRGFRPLEWKEKDMVREKYTGGQEYFLYVGAIHPRKNLINLLKGFSWFKNRHRSNMKLVLAGRMAWGNDDFEKQLQLYKYRNDVVITGYLPDEQMPMLMAAAYALVYPSYWEGFGLPVLEAMQSAVPIITSSNSSMPEVAGDAALYNEPADAEGWGRAMGIMYKDENQRAGLIEKGLQRSCLFSWEESAATLRRVFDQAI